MMFYIKRAISFDGSCDRLEFCITNTPTLLYISLLYILKINDIGLLHSGISFVFFVGFSCLMIIIFFASIVRRSKDAEFSDVAMYLYFLVPVGMVAYPVIANLLATPFALISVNLAAGVSGFLLFLSDIVNIVLGIFALLFHFTLLFLKKVPLGLLRNNV
jgi:uncharacterized membrane protein YhaH (DUF805 family)